MIRERFRFPHYIGPRPIAVRPELLANMGIRQTKETPSIVSSFLAEGRDLISWKKAQGKKANFWHPFITSKPS